MASMVGHGVTVPLTGRRVEMPVRGRQRPGSSAAAASSSSQRVARRPRTPAAGSWPGRRRPAPARPPGPCPAGDEQPDLLGRVDRGEAQADAGRRRLRAVADGDHRPLVVDAAGESGKIEATCPSGPMPEQQQVEPGDRVPVRRRPRPARRRTRRRRPRARRSRRPTAASRGSARSGTPTRSSSASPGAASRCARRRRPARTARRPTRRRPPSSRPSRGPARRPAPATCSRTAMPIPPPVSTTDAEPCTAWAAASRATSASAAARARWSASGSTTTSGRRARLTSRLLVRGGALLRPRAVAVLLGRVEPDVLAVRRAVGQAGDAGRRLQRVAVGLVGVQPAQLLAEQVAERPLGQRHGGVGPERLGDDGAAAAVGVRSAPPRSGPA